MTNHAPIFTGGPDSDSFGEFSNTTNSTALHQLSDTITFKDSDHSDTHTASVALHSAVLSSGSVIPASSLAHFQTAMTSQITNDTNGTGTVKWSFSEADDDFDFLSKNQALVLTYDVTVSDNHGGTAKQTVTITVTGTDDKPVIATSVAATVTEQADQTLSFSPDTTLIAVNFTDVDLTNTNFTARVVTASASGTTTGILPDGLGTAELMSFFHINNVVKASGSSSGTINTTFSAPDLAFDYLAAGEQLKINYVLQLDDHAGGVTTQNVVVTVVGTNDKPVFLCGPETAHLVEDQNVSPDGKLTAHGDLPFADVDLSDSHSVATSVSASLSGGGSISIPNSVLLSAFSRTMTDSTGHVLGDVSWDFALPNSLASAIPGGETLTLTYQVLLTDSAGATTTQNVTITILGTNHPVVITSGPESSTLSELADTTGSATPDTTSPVPTGTLNFTDADTGDSHTVAVSLASETWSGGPTLPAGTDGALHTALATTLHDSTGTGSGGVDWTFSIPDNQLDFLAAGETLTIDYQVQVSDASTTATQTVEVVITGANDAVVITSGPESGTVAEQANTIGSSSLDSTSPTPTGTLAFDDVDLTDHHSVSVDVGSAVWSGGDFVPSGTLNDLQSALATFLHDSTGSGHGGIDWTFSIPDKDLDFLNAGDTLTVTYNVTVSDGMTTSTQLVTITATGAADNQPIVNADVASVADTTATDAGNILAVGNMITDAGDNAGDIGNSLSVTDVNGHAVSGILDVAGTYGTLTVFNDGTYLYTANPALDGLLEGQHATDLFNFTVTDNFGHSTATTLTLNITGSDEAPQITSAVAFGSITEDAGPSLAVNGGFETDDFTGWIASGPGVELAALGGDFGNYTVDLAGSGSLEQDVATVAGQHYSLSFYLAGDAGGGNQSFLASFGGATLVSAANSEIAFGFTKYTFDVVGDGLTDQFLINYTAGISGMHFDQFSLAPTPGPAIETSDGSVSFSDSDPGDTHTASFTPHDSSYFGTFSLDPVAESGGSGSVAWHFSVDNADIQFLAQGQSITQVYTVALTDNAGATAYQDISVTLNGSNDAPTAVSENVITDVGPGGTVDIPAWALAANDTDPDATDHLSVGSVISSSGGAASLSGPDAFFTDDATSGGSFNYTASDGLAASANTATATVINSAASATTLNGTGGNDILIATNGTETLNGGAGNDILFGNSGNHVMSGGAGNDTFAFMHTTDGTATITDFNNTSQHDHIAISASGFGGGLVAGMDVTPMFQTAPSDQFNGLSGFLFDTANQTLYFSADGTQGASLTLAQVQAGVTINPHDILVV